MGNEGEREGEEKNDNDDDNKRAPLILMGPIPYVILAIRE